MTRRKQVNGSDLWILDSRLERNTRGARERFIAESPQIERPFAWNRSERIDEVVGILKPEFSIAMTNDK